MRTIILQQKQTRRPKAPLSSVASIGSASYTSDPAAAVAACHGDALPWQQHCAVHMDDVCLTGDVHSSHSCIASSTSTSLMPRAVHSTAHLYSSQWVGQFIYLADKEHSLLCSTCLSTAYIILLNAFAMLSSNCLIINLLCLRQLLV